MGNLKDILKNPKVVKGILGGLVLGTAYLIYQNIGLKNQNNFLIKENKQIKNEYINSYNELREKKYWDSIKIGFSNFAKEMKMQGEIIKLIQVNDSLEKEYLLSLEYTKELTSQKESMVEELILRSMDVEFCRRYAGYIESLLNNKSNPFLQDTTSF